MKNAIKLACSAALVMAWSIGAAQAQTELTVYTAYENDDLLSYKAAFERDNPDVVINWVRDSTGVITARLLAERNNPRADAIWGLAVTSLDFLKAYDLLEPYEPAGIDALNGNFRDPHSPPYWFGNSAWICAIIYNEIEGARLGVPRPASWQDLVDPAYRNQIVMPHPASSGTGFMYVSAWLQAFGEEDGWAFMDALHENVARYTHSGSAPAVMAGRGEHVIGLAFEVRGSRLKEQGAPVDVILPSDALGWDMNAFAIVRGTARAEAARQLADWAASETAMRLYGSTRSVVAIPGMAQTLSHMPDDLESRIMEQDFSWAAANRERILEEWENRYGTKADPRN